MLSGFSWEPVYVLIPSYLYSGYCQVRLSGRICLPRSTSTPFNRLFRQTAGLSLLRHHIALCISTGILTGSSIGIAIRLILRPRLTLIRLTLIRKPWSFGEGGSRPLYRYLYLHLLFHALQDRSPSPFSGHGMLPYRYLQCTLLSRAFGICLIPDYYPRPDPRPVSCYALFE